MPLNKRGEYVNDTKPQPTLQGYTAWVFEELAREKNLGPGPMAEWIIDRWVEENPGFLGAKGITSERFKEVLKDLRGEKVVPMRKRR